MAKKKDGGLFFPSKRFELVTQFDGKLAPREVDHSGVTLRQWYAGMALSGWMARSDFTIDNDKSFPGEKRAGVCFMMADAMIAFEEKEDV